MSWPTGVQLRGAWNRGRLVHFLTLFTRSTENFRKAACLWAASCLVGRLRVFGRLQPPVRVTPAAGSCAAAAAFCAGCGAWPWHAGATCEAHGAAARAGADATTAGRAHRRQHAAVPALRLPRDALSRPRVPPPDVPAVPRHLVLQLRLPLAPRHARVRHARLLRPPVLRRRQPAPTARCARPVRPAATATAKATAAHAARRSRCRSRRRRPLRRPSRRRPAAAVARFGNVPF